jgi:carboxymethylenebutenolidase
MMSAIAPFRLHQIGTGTARFPSGIAIPTLTDAAVDPYVQTRVSKHVQVECIQFWPQENGRYPGLVLLHESWGLTAQIKDLGARLACEGYGVIIPNLYGRLGGMVTANSEVADALMSKLNESLVLQDINSCCEFLNTRDYIKQNIHGVVGFGMGGSYALRFACQRKRLRAAVVYYGRVAQPHTMIKDLFCPLLYHQAGHDQWVHSEDVDHLRTAAAEYKKPVEILTYQDAPHAFCNEQRRENYRADATAQAWDATAVFLKTCFQGI